jgi:hypothetical protein
MLDIMFAVGCYNLLAMVFNSARVALEPGLTPLEPAARERLHAT